MAFTPKASWALSSCLGPAGPHVRPGWGLGLGVGYDLTRWLAVEARGLGSTHVTDFANQPQDAELLQLYTLFAALKLSFRYRYSGAVGRWGRRDPADVDQHPGHRGIQRSANLACVWRWLGGGVPHAVAPFFVRRTCQLL